MQDGMYCTTAEINLNPAIFASANCDRRLNNAPFHRLRRRLRGISIDPPGLRCFANAFSSSFAFRLEFLFNFVD